MFWGGVYMPKERKLIGKVTHYFDKISVAVIELKGNLKLGDKIEIDNKGETFEQTISSMQIDNEPIKTAKKGQTIGLKVSNPVKQNALVYLK